MNKYYLMLTTLLFTYNNIFSCPCMPSNQDEQAFFEENTEQAEESSENEES